MVRKASVRDLLQKPLSVVLALLIVAALGAIVYLMVVPRAADKFTEFYILGPGGKAADYPAQLTVGEEAKVILGIVNQEHRAASYRVQIDIDGAKSGEVGPVLLAFKEKWEREVTFKPVKPGDNQKVEFILYKDDDSNPYLKLNLQIDVTG